MTQNTFYTSVVPFGKVLLVRTRDEDGTESRWVESDFKPTLYTMSPDGTHTDVFRRKKLAAITFDNIAAAKDYLTDYADSNIPVYGMSNFAYQYIQQNQPKDYHPPKDKIRVFYLDIEVESDDGFPRPEDAAKVVNAITIYDSFTDRFMSWGLGPWYANRSQLGEHITSRVVYRNCATERDLLAAFMSYWMTNYPDVVTGWNSDRFDLVYLYNRITKILSKERADALSPWDKVFYKTYVHMGQEITEVKILGVGQLDYMELYKKHTFKMQESYRLGHIAFVELKDEKMDYSEAGSLHVLYKTNFQKYIDYNIKDCDIVLRLQQKRRILDLAFDLAYMAGVNYADTFSPIRTWDCLIYDYLLKLGVVIPHKGMGEDFTKMENFVGAYVKDIKPNFHRWIVSFDLTSLYPSILRQWNLGVETLLAESPAGCERFFGSPFVDRALAGELSGVSAKLALAHACMAANGTAYRTDRTSFLNDLSANLFTDRKASKDTMIQAKIAMTKLAEDSPEWKAHKSVADAMGTREAALKVMLNSLYGACGNKYFRFFDIRIAEAVTYTGQLVVRWVEARVNKWLNNLVGTVGVDYCIGIDTDSNYWDLEAVVKKFAPNMTEAETVDFLDAVSKQISKDVIEPGYAELQQTLNCREQLMFMKREVIASSAIWRAKKHYCMRVLDSEGVRKEDIKIMGLEAVRSGTPAMCRVGLKEAIKILLTSNDEDDIQDFVFKFRNKFFAAPPEDVALGSSVKNIAKYSDYEGMPTSGCPRHVRAALTYNTFITKNNAELTLEKIKDGEKIKFVELKVPNPISSSVIGFPQFFPRGYGLERYINFQEMFSRTFLGPLETLVTRRGWHTEPSSDISDLFS